MNLIPAITRPPAAAMASRIEDVRRIDAGSIPLSSWRRGLDRGSHEEQASDVPTGLVKTTRAKLVPPQRGTPSR
jgi:hypothetical protein